MFFDPSTPSLLVGDHPWLVTNGVWKGVYPKVFGHSKQLLLNKVFDPSTPSMRKGCDRGEKTGNIGHYIIASS